VGDGVADSLTITLAWPDSLLSPNRVANWRKKAAAKKAARARAAIATRAGVGTLGAMPPDASLEVSFTFCPPDKRRRDLDNMLSSEKSAIDGIADALGVNDCCFVYRMAWGDVVPGGKVVAVCSWV
jgi:crossover junction endodeoxyribonuclease RusA